MTARASRFSLVPRARLRPHEETDAERVKRLAETVREDGALFQPVVVDQGTHVILDGHHRHAALGRLGCGLVPCYLVDYADPTIRVERWEDGRPMDKSQILAHGLSGELLDRKTSRHKTLNELPRRRTPLAAMRPEGGP